VYEISYRATDGKGGSCEGTVDVCVPHDNGSGSCVDDGQRFNSLAPCSALSTMSSRKAKSLRLAVREASGSDITLAYDLPEDADVRVAVYDIAGRMLAVLDDSHRAAGHYEAAWHATGIVRGVYYCRLIAGNHTMTRSILHTR
jgi:hypothetical protein